MSAEFRFKHLSRRAKDRLLARARTDGFAAVLAELREGAAPAPADAGAAVDDDGHPSGKA